jgi:hypothetical protein
MKGDYYTYIIASLIRLQKGVRPRFTLADFLRNKGRFIMDRDWPFFDIMFKKYDGFNLHHLLTEEGRFLPWGTYSEAELMKGLEDGERFPRFMKVYLEEYKGEKIEKVDPLDRLVELYYQDALFVPNYFLRSFFSFEFLLLNIVAALRARAKSLEMKGYIIDTGALPAGLPADVLRVLDALFTNFSAVDFGLGKEFPWLKKVSTLVEEGDFLALEEKLDEIKWQRLNQLTPYTCFGVDLVLAYILKLLILERWRETETGLGERIREGLVAEATAKEEEVPWEIG